MPELSAAATPAFAALSYIRALWSGALPLSRVFWIDMLAVGTLVNAMATVIAMLTFVAGIPVSVGVALHLAPLPYNVLLAMAVWQSAARENILWSWPAQTAAVLWLIASFII